jgi:hypothetical protein
MRQRWERRDREASNPFDKRETKDDNKFADCSGKKIIFEWSEDSVVIHKFMNGGAVRRSSTKNQVMEENPEGSLKP